LKKILISCFLVLYVINCNAQQYPWWTQYKSNQMLANPAFSGTKRLVDIRLNYRNQWTGFEGAPKTYVLSLNSRLWKGRLGLGGFVFNDVIGPFKTTNSSLNVAYHLKFPDSEFSIGFQGNYMKQKFIGTDITLRNQQDKAVNQYITDKAGDFDASIGLLYYNDRFHIGLGANNIVESALEYYKNDTLKKGNYTNSAHYNFSAGYNWSDNPDFTFENSIYAAYVSGVPFLFDYTLRLHIKKQLLVGGSIRFGDAIALQLGYTIKGNIQIVYSYDFVTSALRKYQSGTHEISMIFSSNFGTDKKKRGFNGRFLKQRFQYLL
jgi:type IX secretion system PorP/SprF family membrane protein